MGLLRPHFCLLHKIFDVTILAKPFVFHKTRWNFVLAANLPRDVWSNAIIWRNQNKNALTLCVWREVSRVHTFWSASTQRKHSVFARRFQRVRSEKNIIEGALMTKRPYYWKLILQLTWRRCVWKLQTSPCLWRMGWGDQTFSPLLITWLIRSLVKSGVFRRNVAKLVAKLISSNWLNNYLSKEKCMLGLTSEGVWIILPRN